MHTGAVATARSIVYAPVGDGQRRRRGSDAVRVATAVALVLLCWVATRANSSSEHAIASVLHTVPDGVKWLISAVWWVMSFGVIALIAVLAVASRRWAAVRDVALAGLASWAFCEILVLVLGADGGRPPDPSLGVFNLTFPLARVAATAGVATAGMPYLSRSVQRLLKAALVLLAVASVAGGSGLPMAVVAGLAVGWGMTAAVHLWFGSPLGLPSVADVAALVDDLGVPMEDVRRHDHQEWGVGRFTGRLDGRRADVAVYGRDASDAQLLAKVFRFLFYRDSGPTLALTRRQQVEHEAFLTLMAARAGVRAPGVLAAGTAGPSHDALLVTEPPRGRPLRELVPPPPAGAAAAPGVEGTADDPPPDPPDPPDDPVLADATLDDLFAQVRALGAADITHGALSPETVIVGEDGSVGLTDFRSASLGAAADQRHRDVAAALAAAGLVVGAERAVASAARALDGEDLHAALPFLQRAALDSVGSRALRGRKALLTDLRARGAEVVGVDVPKLVEPRRVSWVNLALVLGTLIGGWALIGVLVNVGKSWSTITGADWAWVAAVFVLAQAAYPAVAVTTVGSVTDPLPYGRTVALEVANTFVALAGGSMAVLATRVRFFQQEGYTPTLAVSSGVVASTASWIVKGGLFLIALPLALGSIALSKVTQPDTSAASTGDSNGHLLWLIVVVVVLVGVVLGIVLAVPRFRRMASDRLRPKATEVWGHLRLLAGHPRNLVEIFGGSIVAQLVVALALGAALHAFGQHLSLATIIVVLTLGSMLGGVSPVPGGMGVVEAGMILGLTAAGISQSDAVAAVFVQRLFTAYLPPIWGWFVLVWLRRREYL